MRERKAFVALLLLMITTFLSFSNTGQIATSRTCTSAAVAGGEAKGGANSAARPTDSQVASQGGDGSSLDVLYLSNLTAIDATALRVADLVDINMLKSTIGYLSGFDNRYTGSVGSLNSITFIRDFFRTNCSIPSTFLDNFTFNDQGTQLTASNVIAKINSPVPTNKTLMITAHHDTIGFQYPFTVYSNGTHGADDDASGVGVLLETARLLSAFKGYLKCNLLFAVFAAEEGNRTMNSAFMRQGSTHWATTTHMGVGKLSDVIAAVNLDEVAYRYGGYAGVYYHTSGASVASNVSSSASILNIPVADKQGPRTDSYVKPVRCKTEDTFQNSGIPAVTLSTQFTNPYTHTAQDTVLKLDYDIASNITKVTVCYACLIAGIVLKGGESYARNWIPTLLNRGQLHINEVNYVIASVNPTVVSGNELVIIDPSVGGITSDRLLPIISACSRDARKTPLLALGNGGQTLLRILDGDKLDFTVRNTWSSDLVAHIEGGIGGISYHPVFNSPNNINFSYGDSTQLNYTVLETQPGCSTSISCYLVQRNTQSDSVFLSLGYTPLLSESWSWLGVLNDQSISNCTVGFIGVDNASTLTDFARKIAENMAWLLLNGSRTDTTIELSKRNPLVGDRIKVAVEIRNSLTWKGNSSLLADLEVISPSGNLLLRETHLTDENGLAQFSQMLLTEVGEHHVTMNIKRAGEDVTKITSEFGVGYRIEIANKLAEIHVIQGEQINLRLNLTYVPDSPEDVALMLAGQPFLSNISLHKTLKHGHNDVSIAIAVNETVPVGEYNVSLLIMPTTTEYTADCRDIRLIVSPAYDVRIVEAPSTMSQGSIFQLVVQVSSHRSTMVVATLSTGSRNILVRGEATTTILAGETKQVTLMVEEASASPYQWGDGEIKIILLRNGQAVVESSPFSVFVSLNITSLFLGYVLPAVLPLPVLVERSKKMRARLAATGIIIGGTLFFSIGLVICQSLFMFVPLTMLILGCHVGAAAMKHIYELPLPKGYNWILPTRETNRTNLHIVPDVKAESIRIIPIPEYAHTGLGKLRELYERGRYWDTIPAGYMLAMDILEDSLISSIGAESRNHGHYCYPATEDHSDRTLRVLLGKLERQGVKGLPLTRLKRLQKIYDKYTELSKQRPKGEAFEPSAKNLARSTVSLIAEFLLQKEQ